MGGPTWHWREDGDGWMKKEYEDELVKISRCIAGESQEVDECLKVLSALDAPFEKEAVSLIVKLGAQLSRPHLGMVLVYFNIMRGIGRREVERDVKIDADRYEKLLRRSQEVIRCKRDVQLNLAQALRDLEEAINACHGETAK